MRISDWSSDVCSSDLLPPHRGERGIDLAQVGFDGAQADSHFGGYIALEDAVDAETAKDARGPLAGGGNRLFDERELLTRDERSLCRRFLDRSRLDPRSVDRKRTRLNSSHKCASRRQHSA